MSEADILALTYDDVVTVRRARQHKTESKETVFVDETVYTGVPCALSKQDGGKLGRSPSTQKTPTGWCLFTRPEIDILPGDKLEVLHLGKVEHALAGKAERHSSHNNVPVSLESELV